MTEELNQYIIQKFSSQSPDPISDSKLEKLAHYLKVWTIVAQARPTKLMMNFILANYVRESNQALWIRMQSETGGKRLSDEEIKQFYSAQPFALNFKPFDLKNKPFYALNQDSFTLDMSREDTLYSLQYPSYARYNSMVRQAEKDFRKVL